MWALADTHWRGNRRCVIHLTDIRDGSSCTSDVVIGASSPALTKRTDTSSRLYSVVNSGGVTAEVLGEPLVIEGDPLVVVGGGGPLPVPFRRGEGIVYCDKSKPNISLERVAMVV